MKKSRLIYMILSVLLSILLETVAIYYGKYIFLITIVSFSLLLSNLQKKKNEIEDLKRIILEFNINCDVDMYLLKLNEFKKKCIFSKKQLAYFNLYSVTGYMEKGEFDKAEQMLLSIDEYSNKFNMLGRFIYLKNWADLFFHKNLNEKMKLTLLSIREVIDAITNDQFKIALLQSYQITEGKYFILVNRDIDKVRVFFKDKSTRERSNLYKINYKFYEALCNIRLNKTEAINMISEIASVNKNIYSCIEASKMLDKINNI